MRILSFIPDGNLCKSPLILPTQNAGLTEVDAVLVHKAGIFVFENKEFSGSLSGGVNDRLWMKSSDTTISVVNPILQNRHHVEAVSHVLGVPLSETHSVIVISDACDVSRVPASRGDFILCHTSDVRENLARLFCRDVFSKEETAAFVRRLDSFAGDKKSTEKHLKYIADRKKERKSEKKKVRNNSGGKGE